MPSEDLGPGAEAEGVCSDTPRLRSAPLLIKEQRSSKNPGSKMNNYSKNISVRTTYWVDLLMGSFLGFNNFRIIIVPEVLDSFTTRPANYSICPEVIVAPLAGADWTDRAGLVAGVVEDSRPHFFGLGLEVERRCFQQQKDRSLRLQ